MKEHRFPLMCLLAVLIALFVSVIKPYDLFTWFLEVTPILIAAPLLLVTYSRFRFTNLVYGLIAIHALILCIGAHYTYARVPFFDWFNDILDTGRNSYDGLGHLAQGFVPALVIRELLLRTSPLRPGKWLFWIIVFCCLAIGALYEILEWLAAASTGEAAEDFLGTQGDAWDTQKDMFLAGVGAIIGLLSLGRAHDKALKKLLG